MTATTTAAAAAAAAAAPPSDTKAGPEEERAEATESPPPSQPGNEQRAPELRLPITPSDRVSFQRRDKNYAFVLLFKQFFSHFTQAVVGLAQLFDLEPIEMSDMTIDADTGSL